MTKINAESVNPLNDPVLSSLQPKLETPPLMPALSDKSVSSSSAYPPDSDYSDDGLSASKPKLSLKEKKKLQNMKVKNPLLAALDSKSKPKTPTTFQPPSEPKPKEPTYEYIVIHRLSDHKVIGGLNSKGHLIVDRGNSHFYNSVTNESCPRTIFSDQAGTMRAKQLSVGCYEHSNEFSEIKLESPFAHRSCPSFKVGDTVFPQADKLIVVPLYNSLERRFPNPHISTSNLNAFMACSVREFGSVHTYLLTNTIDYFVSQVYVRAQLLKNKKNTAIVKQMQIEKSPDSRSFEQPSTLDAQEYLTSMGQTIDHGTFYRAYAESPQREVNITDNGNFTITDSNGYTPSQPTGVGGQFATLNNEHPKLYRTVFSRLVGEKDFRVLDKDGEQVGYAMERLYKARDNEVELRANQYDILSYCKVDKEVLSWCTNEPDPSAKIRKREDIDTSEVSKLARFNVASFFTQYRGNNIPAIVYYLLITIALLPVFIMDTFLATSFWLAGNVGYIVLFIPVALSNVFRSRLIYLKRPTKVKLYLRWFYEKHRVFGYTNDFHRDPPVEAKFKNEMAKPGKVGRLFVSYGESILNAGWMYGHIKTMFCRTHDLKPYLGETDLDACEVTVVKSLDEGYKPEIRGPGLYSRVFSDDMTNVYVTKTGETVHFDADISSCDSGNTTAMFYLLATLTCALGFRQHIKRSYSRLKEVITIFNPSTSHYPRKKREFVKLKPKTIFQGSGCPETTMVNNCASTSIIIAFATYISESNTTGLMIDSERVWFDDATNEQRGKILALAAASVGHKVTIDWCSGPEQTQFLKYSVFETAKGPVNARNFGAIFRGLASMDGDITSKTLGITKKEFSKLSMEDKMERYVSAVVLGLKNEPSSIVMDALRERFSNNPNCHMIKGSYNHEEAIASNRYTYRIELSELQKRYGGETHEWEQLVTAIRDMRLGTVIPAKILTNFYAVDYGL